MLLSHEDKFLQGILKHAHIMQICKHTKDMDSLH